jgi:hypothetical protein
MTIAERDGAWLGESAPNPASWAKRHRAAYRAAEQEMALLQPSAATLYHEGHLAIDAVKDPAVAGRAAAFWDATEAERGLVAQRRLGFERYQYIFWRVRREPR